MNHAVVPVAGRATRMWPLSLVGPKELLPMGTLPVIHHVLLELAAAGVDHIILVIGPTATAVPSYFGRVQERPAVLGDAAALHERLMSGVRLTYVWQASPTGIADAIYAARHLLPQRPYFVHMGDSVLFHPSNLLHEMLRTHEKAKPHATIAVSEAVPHRGTSNAVAIAQGDPKSNSDFRIDHFVDVRTSANALGPYVIGRYLLEPPLPTTAVSGFGRLGGLNALINKPDEAICMGVHLCSNETLLGAGTILEYLASWKLITSRDG